MELPLAARRLFGAPGEGAGAGDGDGAGGGGSARLDVASPDPYVLALLLEDGDRADLAWLCRQMPEGALAAWLERHGARRLSRRSLAFWAVVLERSDLLGVPAWPREAAPADLQGEPSGECRMSTLDMRRPAWPREAAPADLHPERLPELARRRELWPL
jgi:hypothetical protein